MMEDQSRFIEGIRRSYGIGLDGGPDQKLAFANLWDNLSRAVDELSRDLYSKDIHFVLELIQNAEDNSYGHGVEPRLTFDVDSDRVLVQNNEIGFQEANVKAVCQVGKSTKRKDRGYIGEKGIGFKSVFRVSDEPHVYSNGFQFRLSSRVGPDQLRFILPEWVEDVPAYINPALTNIVLPINDHARGELSKLGEVEPSLLLFLEKLRAIEIRNRLQGTVFRASKRLREDGILEIEHTEGREHWKLVRTSLAVPDTLREEKRAGVAETELILGFPVTEESVADTERERLLYAFLPLERSYGFRFVIQADFLLPASREDLHKNSQWNEWLRDEVPDAFMRAVDEFKGSGQLGSTYYDYIPLPAQVSDPFFSPVMRRIHEKIREAECFLAESGAWLKPGRICRADEKIRSLIPNAELKHLLGLEYIAREVLAGEEVLGIVGTVDFDYDRLVSCLKNTEWLDEKTDEWFMQLYAYLDGAELKISQVERLKSIPLVRLAGGKRLACTGRTKVFFPFEGSPGYGFEGEIDFLDDFFVHSGSQATREASTRFLAKRLGIHEPTPPIVIEDHILPAFENSDPATGWRSKSDDILLGYVTYIKDKGSDCVRPLGVLNDDRRLRLRRALRLKLKGMDGPIYAEADLAYLGADYGNTDDLESLLADLDHGPFVCPDYVSRDVSRSSCGLGGGDDPAASAKLRRDIISGWRAFLLDLGAADFIRGPDVIKVADSGEVERVRRALRYLDDNWARARKLFQETNFVRDRRGIRFPEGMKRTNLAEKLIEKSWIPTAGAGLAKPRDVYIDLPSIRSLLGDSVSYLGPELQSTELLQVLGMNTGATVSSVLTYLGQLARSGCSDRGKIESIYSYLDGHSQGHEEEVRLAFAREPLIFVPGAKPSYMSARAVFWEDLRQTFGPSRGYLKKHYPDRRGFFVDRLSVAETARPRDYSDRLIELSGQPSIDPGGERAILRCYDALERALRKHPDLPEENWWSSFKVSDICWTERGEFRPPFDDVFVNDQDDVRGLFADAPSLSFVKLPPNYHPRYKHLFLLLGVHRISEYSPRLQGEVEASVEEGLTWLLRSLHGPIARFLYHSEHELYEMLKEKGDLSRLRDVEVRVVPELSVCYTLGGVTRTTTRGALASGGHVYLQEDAIGDVDRLGVEFAKSLGDPKGLANLLITMFEKRDPLKIKRYLDTIGIPPLPEVEEDSPGEGLVHDDGPAHRGSYRWADDECSFGHVGKTQAADGGPSRLGGAVLADPDASGPGPSPVGGDGTQERVSSTADGRSGGKTPSTPEPNSSPVHDDRDEVRPFSVSYDRNWQGSEKAWSGGRSPRAEDSSSIGGGDMGTCGRPSPPAGTGLQGTGLAGKPEHTGEIQARRGKHSGGRVVTYVNPAGPVSLGEESLSDEERRKFIELGMKAVEAVILYEKARGRIPREMAHNHPGFDVRSVSSEGSSGQSRTIEVKGIRGRWTERGVALSSVQFQTAQSLADQFWLYVVQDADAEDPRCRTVFPIRNPAAKITEFRFDKGWSVLTEPGEPEVDSPIRPGVRITLGDQGEGLVEGVRKQGILLKLSVRLANGDLKQYAYRPKLMKILDPMKA